MVNARTGVEISIPRHFLGEISRIEDPVVIVGLLKELEYREGAVWPYYRRVIEMPVAVGARPAAPASPAQRTGPAPVIGIRLESKGDSHVFRIVGGALVLGIVAAYVAVNFYRESTLRPRVSLTARDKSFYDLGARDTYDSVVRKLGAPAGDHWRAAENGRRYRALWYPERAWTVVLAGADGQEPVYIGTLDADWNPIHAVQPGLLSGLRRLTQ